MEYERHFKFLICAPSFNDDDLDWLRLQQIVKETERLGFQVLVARSTDDAELAIQTDAAIGCMVVDWGKKGVLSKPAGLISLVRKRGPRDAHPPDAASQAPGRHADRGAEPH